MSDDMRSPGVPVAPASASILDVTRALDGLLPAMVVDGGGAEIVSADASGVVVKLVGSCTFCPSRRMSAEALDRGLRARLPSLGRLRIVTDGRQGCEEVTATVE